MLKRQFTAILVSLSLLIGSSAVMPGAAFAATDVVITATPQEGDRGIQIDYKKANKNNPYRIERAQSRGGAYSTIGRGTLGRCGSGSMFLKIDAAAGELKKGDYVRVILDNQVDEVQVRAKVNAATEWVAGGYFSGDHYYNYKGKRYLWHTDVSGNRFYEDNGKLVYIRSGDYAFTDENQSGSGTNTTVNSSPELSAPWPPSAMSLSTDRLPRRGGDVQIRFDRDYGMALGDGLKVVALDAGGKTVSEKTYDMVSLRYPPMISLVPEASVAKYRIEFIGAKGNEATIAKELPVEGQAAEPGFSEAKGIKLNYAVRALTPGAVVKAPEVFLVDVKGKTMKVNEGISFAVSGDAIEADSVTADGGFQVKKTATPGSRAVIRVNKGNLQEEVILQVPMPESVVHLTSTISQGLSGQLTEVPVEMMADGKPYHLPWAAKETKVKVDGGVAEVKIKDGASPEKDGKLTLLIKGTAKADLKLALQFTGPKGEKVETKAMAFRLIEPALPAAEKHTVSMTIGALTMKVDGKDKALDAKPLISNSRTYVPYRALAQAFGAEVKWDDKSRRVYTTLADKKVAMEIDKTSYSVNGEVKTMDVAPFIQNGRTMVPVRFVAEAIGFKVTPMYYANGSTQGVVFTN